MKYAAYGEYKTSPMTWLDRLPTHWNAASLRWMSKRYAGGTPDKGNEAYWVDGEIPWINSGAVNDGYITEPSELITREGFANSSAKWIPKDALVMALAGQGKTKGMVAQLGIPTTCNQSMAALIPDHRFAPRYLYYWLTANYQNIRNLAGGEARDGLNLEMLGSIPCPVPPVNEQQTIARLLDAKTAQIDALVAQKRQLIDKLKEKRSALIARTVTRGLSAGVRCSAAPTVRLKPTGHAWLSVIPEHWCRTSLKRVASVRGRIGFRGYTTDDLVDEGDGALTLGGTNLTKLGRLDLTKRTYLSWFKYEESPEIKVEVNDLVIGQRGTCGDVVLIDQDIGPATINPSLVLLKQPRIHSGFLCYWLTGKFVQSIFDTYLSATAVPMLSQEQIGNVPVFYPPFDEQTAIVEYLDTASQRLDTLAAKAELAIERLREYRSALITSAVTGKIDVRGLS